MDCLSAVSVSKRSRQSQADPNLHLPHLLLPVFLVIIIFFFIIVVIVLWVIIGVFEFVVVVEAPVQLFHVCDATTTASPREEPPRDMLPVMIVGVILSGGASTRMGQPKALMAVAPSHAGAPPTSFLERIADNFAAAGVGPVIVVTGTHDSPIRAHVAERGLAVTVVTNPDPSRGQLSSLWCALDAMARLDGPVEAMAMSPVDHPWTSAATVARLVEDFRATRASVVRPLAADGTHGHPVVFGPKALALLRDADLAQGAKAVINALAHEVHHVPVDDHGAFADVDTLEDYARGLEAMGDRLDKTHVTRASGHAPPREA